MTQERPGWRNLEVAKRVVESRDVVSLHLISADGSSLPPFVPGQFLTFRLPGRAGRPVPRNYSISSDPADLSQYRISVKREPEGMGSGYMHDAMKVGASIEAIGPRGDFGLDPVSTRPVLLLAGGIGITPLLAMAHALARDGSRPVFLFHACRDGAVQPFRTELADLAKAAANLSVFTLLERATAEDRNSPHFAGEGRVTRALLRETLPLDGYQAYLCGPQPFMQATFEALVSLGLPESRIAYEFFGPAIKLEAQPAQAVQAPQKPVQAPAPAPDDRTRITFVDSGITAAWDGNHRTLLDFAEAMGLNPAFSCRNGICNTCLTKIDGKVRYLEEPLDEPGPGNALLCCSVPDGPLSVRL
jgi:ferredoxin-NADP reductase/ferredoxin